MARQEGTRGLSLRGQLLLACIAPVVLMLGNTAASRRALNESISTTNSVVHTSEVIGAINDLMKVVVDAETGQRGFLLTKNPLFLEPYVAAMSSFWKKQAELERLVSDNPAQEVRLTELESAFQDWQRIVAEPSIRDQSLVLERERDGKGHIDHIRRVVQELVEVQRSLLRQRIQSTEFAIARSKDVSNAVTALSCAFALALALYLSIGISRAITEVASAARGVEEGNLARRANVRRRDEIGVLAESFNTMAERLAARDREASFLASLSEELQACLNLDEATAAFLRFTSSGLDGTSGAVFLTSASRDVVIRRLKWGIEKMADVVGPENCWALRKGHAHYVEDTISGARCDHLTLEGAVSSLCVPLLAHAETIGILHVASPVGALNETRRHLVSSVAEQLAQAVANLQLQEMLRAQSIRDPLTGLFNRRYLEETLPRELSRAKRATQTVGVIALDVDHFKRFNDTFGHEAGDIVLREIGNVIRSGFRESDIGARLGGEEFVIVLPNTDPRKVTTRADQLRDSIKGLSLSDRGTPLGRITISIGVAMFPESATKPEDLLRAADLALYRAKNEGRDRCVVAQPVSVVNSFATIAPELGTPEG